MRSCIVLCAALAAFILPSAVRADWTSAGRATVVTGPELMTGRLGDMPFTRAGLATDMRVGLTDRLSLSGGFSAGYMQLNFSHQPTMGLVARGMLMTPFETSGRLGASYALLAASRYRLEAFAGFETSLPGAAPEISALSVRTNDGSFDVSDFAKQNAYPMLFWRRLSVGAEFRTAFGRFEPMASIAFEEVTASIDLRIGRDAGATLASLGFSDGSLERRYAASQGTWLVPIRAGLGYRLDPDDAIQFGGMFAPGGGPLLGARLSYAHTW